MVTAMTVHRPVYVTAVSRVMYDDTQVVLDLTRPLSPSELRLIEAWLVAINLAGPKVMGTKI